MHLICYPGGLDASAYAVPDGTGNIGGGAFSHNRNLKSLTIPASVIGIGDDAFSYCTGLESLTLGTGVRDIGTNPLIGCDALTEISLSPDNPCLEMIDGVLFSETEQRLVSYPAALTATAYFGTAPTSEHEHPAERHRNRGRGFRWLRKAHTDRHPRLFRQ